MDLLVNGYALIPPSPGYSEDADFPLEDAVEIPDALIKLAIARRSKQEGEFSGGNIQEGKRNATLASLAGVMRRQGMSFDEIFAALDQANERRCLPPLSTAEIRQIALSVSRYEPQPDKDMSETHNLTDLGNGKRFAGLHGGNVLYAAERKKWIFWNGKHWEWDITGKIVDLAEDVLRGIYEKQPNRKKKMIVSR